MKYAHVLNCDTGEVHRIPRKKFDAVMAKMKQQIEGGEHADFASNNAMQECSKFPVKIYIDWMERIL